MAEPANMRGLCAGKATEVALQGWLQARSRCHGLQMHNLIAEERPGTACRAVAVFRKGDDPEACAMAWPCRRWKATSEHSPKESLSMEGADAVRESSMRDKGYGESRTAKAGLEADIWRHANHSLELMNLSSQQLSTFSRTALQTSLVNPLKSEACESSQRHN